MTWLATLDGAKVLVFCSVRAARKATVPPTAMVRTRSRDTSSTARRPGWHTGSCPDRIGLPAQYSFFIALFPLLYRSFMKWLTL